VDQRIFTPTQIEAERTLYQRTNLIQLPIDAHYNANVLRITDDSISEYIHKAFIAPRLYSYGAQSGGKLIPARNADGTVTLAFNVIFLDGTSSIIARPDQGNTQFELPSSFVIQDQTGLKSLLQTQFGADNTLTPLPGCPKTLTLSTPGHEYDVTPAEYAHADFCQLNAPVMVSLTVPESQAREILQNFLPNNLVAIKGIYESKVSIPSSKVEVHFDRSKMFSSLEAQMSAKIWITDLEAKYASTTVAQNQLMKVVIQGRTSDLEDKLIQQITSEFFTPWKPDPMTGMTKPDCGSAICMSLDMKHQDEGSTMDFEWSEESNMMSGQKWETTAKLRATPKSVQIGDTVCHSNEDAMDSGRGIYQVGACKRLKNDGTARETGLTVNEGDQLKIDPSYMIEEQFTQINPPMFHEPNTICTASHPVCDFPPPTPHCIQNNCFKTASVESVASCHQECDAGKTVDLWVDTWNYSAPASSALKIDSPTGQINQLYTGLMLGFEWTDHFTGEKREKFCPLSVFQREGDGNSLKVTLQNVPTCSPFSTIPSETPMLFLANAIHPSDTYTVGQVIKRWNGTSETHIESKTYYPAIDFAGTLTIDGYSLGSEPGPSSKI